MKNAPVISFVYPGSKGLKIIERWGRHVGEVIGQACVSMMTQGVHPKIVLIGRDDYHLLMNELGRKWGDGPFVLATPAGEVQVWVDPTVELGVRALSDPGKYYRLLNNPKLLEPR